MFFPIKDENPAIRKPVVTVTLIAACVAVFLWEVTAGEAGLQQIVYRYGLVPSAFFGAEEFPAELLRCRKSRYARRALEDDRR